MNSISPPNNFIDIVAATTRRDKNRIKNNFEIVRRGRVAVQIKGAGGLEGAVYLGDAKGHADEIGEQTAPLQDRSKPFDEVNGLGGEPAAVVGKDFGIALVRLNIPFPRIHKRLRLRPVLAADVVVNLVIISLTIEGGITIAKINGLVFDIFPQDFEVVAVVKCIQDALTLPL